ncbi:DDE-type integrase/transposase/recombinase [Embleya sp. NPDC008237]|uniref:DDE-type integrase/transposase/recombinase n=1 Tax=Embleya sp. NPDC008237 TaxID=3363978 RepID=UPI0036E60B77
MTTLGDGSHPRIPDLVVRDLDADRIGAKLVGDITYISTWEGFLYLATVIDCHSKAVVGWAMADHFKTSLISSAPYTSEEFARALAGHGMRQSVGRTGVCRDNAMAESYFGALKNEWLHRYVFPHTRKHAAKSSDTSRASTTAAASTRESAMAHPTKSCIQSGN